MLRNISIMAVVLLLACTGAYSGAQDKTLTVRSIAEAPTFAKRALVIGVGQYEHANSLAPETYNDARRFADMLRTQFKFPDIAVSLLTDAPGTAEKDRPTYVHLKSAFNRLVNGLTDRSEVIVYFSGHGIRAENRDWLVPLDGDPEDVTSTCINYDDIKSRLNTKTPARALLIVDACRNLAGGKTGASSGFGAGKGLAGPQFAEILSCQPRETSQVGKPGDFSERVFTHYLLAGLAGDTEAQENGVVTFDSLKGYVQRKVSQYVSAKYGSTQLPDGRASLGRMVLARPQRAVVEKQGPIPPAVDPEVPAVKPEKERQGGGVARAPKLNPTDSAEMVYVPGGAFTMGETDRSDNPPHQVTLSGYYIYKTPVTVAQYSKFCAATGQKMPTAPSWGWKDDHPIVNVSWNDAQAYCKWASVRLPTEAEWEKAARGTDGRKFPWGSAFDGSKLWFSKAVLGDAKSTAPVGSFPSGASPYGVLDMAGNVWQWCQDWYDNDYTKTDNLSNPTGPGFGKYRVLRGGSWVDNYPGIFRASDRGSNDPSFRTMTLGFWCVSQD